MKHIYKFNEAVSESIIDVIKSEFPWFNTELLVPGELILSSEPNYCSSFNMVEDYDEQEVFEVIQLSINQIEDQREEFESTLKKINSNTKILNISKSNDSTIKMVVTDKFHISKEMTIDIEETEDNFRTIYVYKGEPEEDNLIIGYVYDNKIFYSQSITNIINSEYDDECSSIEDKFISMVDERDITIIGRKACVLSGKNGVIIEIDTKFNLNSRFLPLTKKFNKKIEQIERSGYNCAIIESESGSGLSKSDTWIKLFFFKNDTSK